MIELDKYRPLLQEAVRQEEAHSSDPNYLGWRWDEVRAYPASLTKLVVEGLIRINFRSNSTTNYLLVDRRAIKKALGP